MQNKNMATKTQKLMSELRNLRKAEGITLLKVSNKMGVDESVVSKLETTTENITMDSLVRYIESIGGHLEITVKVNNNKKTIKLL